MRRAWLYAMLSCCTSRSSVVPAIATPNTPAIANAVAPVRLEHDTIALPGEAMEFHVMFGGLSIGVVQTAVGQPGEVDGRRAVIVRSHAHGEGLVATFAEVTWELTTTLDVATGLPIDDHQDVRAAYAGHDDHGHQEHTWNASDRFHDIHSVICAVRAWASQPGQRTWLTVRIGDSPFRVVLIDTGREYVVSAKAHAVHYTGTIDQHVFDVWVSDDAQRVPLLAHTHTPLGEVSLELVDYQPPAE